MTSKTFINTIQRLLEHYLPNQPEKQQLYLKIFQKLKENNIQGVETLIDEWSGYIHDNS